MGTDFSRPISRVDPTAEHRNGAVCASAATPLGVPTPKGESIGENSTGSALPPATLSITNEYNWQSIIPRWSSWSEVPKTEDGRYGLLAGRRYTPHAINQMCPRDLGVPHGEKSGLEEGDGWSRRPHSVAPRYVEDAIRNGIKHEAEWNKKYKEMRVLHVSGQLSVVTSEDGSLVISVYTTK